MLSIYTFWIWAIAISGIVLLFSKSRFKNLVFSLYRPLMVAGFSIATLAGVQFYIRAALSGSTDSAIGLFYHQAYINPIVYFLLGLGLDRYIELPIWDLSSTRVMGCAAEVISIQLWNVMVADFLLGNIFWMAVCSFWLKIIERKQDKCQG